MKALPIHIDELIDTLDKEYPARCIQKNESLEQHLRYAGKRELVDYLLSLREKGKEKIL